MIAKDLGMLVIIAGRLLGDFLFNIFPHKEIYNAHQKHYEKSLCNLHLKKFLVKIFLIKILKQTFL